MSAIVNGDVKVAGDVLLADETRTQPVIYLPMNEGSGNPSDESEAGNNLNGTLGGATWSTTNFVTAPSSLSFDGTNDYVDLGTSTTLKPNTAMSISAWVYSESYGSDFKYIVAAWPGEGAASNYSFFNKYTFC